MIKNGKNFILFISILFRIYFAVFVIAAVAQLILRGYYKDFSVAYLVLVISSIARAVQIWYKGSIFVAVKPFFSMKNRIDLKLIKKYLLSSFSIDIFLIFSNLCLPQTDYNRDTAVAGFEQGKDFISKTMVLINSKSLEAISNFIIPNFYGFETIVLLLLIYEFERQKSRETS